MVVIEVVLVVAVVVMVVVEVVVMVLVVFCGGNNDVNGAAGRSASCGDSGEKLW